MQVEQLGDSADPYSYDAPHHVMHDFGLDAEDNADQWFDLIAAPENGVIEQLITPVRGFVKPLEGSHNDPKEPKAAVSPMVEFGTTVSSSNPSNIVTSWGNSKPAAAPGQARKKAGPVQARRVSKRAAIKSDSSQGPSMSPVTKKRRVITTPKPIAFRHQRRSATGMRPARPSATSTAIRSSIRLKTKPAVTSASTSTVQQQKSTEEQEIERIEALQKEVAEQRRRNEASFRAALAGHPPSKKQVLSTTIPKEFHFRSDNRAKNSDDASEPYKETNFTSQLRKHTSVPLTAHKGATIPKPFNLSAGSKRKLEESDSAYVPMAEQIEQFQKRTPVRYHLRSRQSQERGPSPVKTGKPKVTCPHTPQLITRQRTRPTVVKSSAELEAEEIEKLQQFKFKAVELNRKILESVVPPKKPPAKEATRPEGFRLEVEKRLQGRHATKKSAEPEDGTFHARPLPTRILEEVVGVPGKKVINPTVPESPAFALKNRVRVECKIEEVLPPALPKAHPVPHYVPFHPKPAVKNHVEVCPFSFEQRDQERKARKEKRLEELRNEEAPKFKARPLPDFSDVTLPEKKMPEPTKPAPFSLIVDKRGALKSQRLEQMVKEEIKLQAEVACFKARPNTTIHKEPFVPKKENRATMVSETFQLSTERRAKERLEFEQALKEKETLRAQMEKQQTREREEQEKDEISRLREEQTYKAQPIRCYKPVELKHSETKLTVPQSPKFSNRFRF